jgi:hypothetical protein
MEALGLFGVLLAIALAGFLAVHIAITRGCRALEGDFRGFVT